jgi:hypothetical protein
MCGRFLRPNFGITPEKAERRLAMQHNPMLLANVEIEQAQRQARARAERRARSALHPRREHGVGFFARLWRR